MKKFILGACLLVSQLSLAELAQLHCVQSKGSGDKTKVTVLNIDVELQNIKMDHNGIVVKAKSVEFVKVLDKNRTDCRDYYKERAV